tara:strand:- start:616 stop:807 length:192 start_codon:yes stop_codon:yes gene_type:complete
MEDSMVFDDNFPFQDIVLASETVKLQQEVQLLKQQNRELRSRNHELKVSLKQAVGPDPQYGSI